MTANASARSKSRLGYEANPRLYRFMRWLLSGLMRLLYRYEVLGCGYVPVSGPLILAVNHTHLFDALVVAPAIPRMIVTLAAEKYLKNLVVGTFLRLAGAIFVYRGEVDRDALRSCLQVLSAGGTLAVAPEGTRTKTGGMQQAKPGIAYLALRSKAPILPIALVGVDQLGRWRPWKRPTCHVIIGRPFTLSAPTSKPTTEQLQDLADQVMVRIGSMLPVSYHGVYAAQIAAGTPTTDSGRADGGR
jgi:1-acyl-sn-glycerol-3-phosphate acyltransferase